MTSHQQKQIENINTIKKQIENNALQFSTVAPVEDYENDPRLCLTSVHIPHENVIKQVESTIINYLRGIEPKYYYYSSDSLHMTIKNVRVVSNPPHFTQEDIEKVEDIFSKVIPGHKKFFVYFYQLLLFPTNLALIGTTDPELDTIFNDLDTGLRTIGFPDDKKYNNTKYIFSNMTLARFPKVSEEFRMKVRELSNSLRFEPYQVDSVTLVTCNAVFKRRRIINTWKLK